MVNAPRAAELHLRDERAQARSLHRMVVRVKHRVDRRILVPHGAHGHAAHSLHQAQDTPLNPALVRPFLAMALGPTQLTMR